VRSSAVTSTRPSRRSDVRSGPPVRTLLLGASGFLGANVALALADTGTADLVAHVGTGWAPELPGTVEVVRADLTDASAVEGLLGGVDAELIVNCAALADVDRCERDVELADRLNHLLPAQLAQHAARRGAALVHVSTDAVFDGTGTVTAASPTAPLNAYGRSKVAGEQAVLAAHPGALVARTNIVGWSPSGSRSLLEYFHDRLARGEPAPGFIDLWFRPLPVQRFWPTCVALLDAGLRGVVHVTGPELLTKHDFGRRVATTFGYDPELVVAASGRGADRAAVRAACLDVLPSTLPDGRPPLPGGLDEGLEELRQLAAAGHRRRLAGHHQEVAT
jgi:dTDP-4-dehydrorhamnose reductase